MKKGTKPWHMCVVDKPLLRALAHQTLPVPPIWLMRQAGRYLPEYRVLRTRAPSFLAFCYTPELAVEASLQPIRRYALDAAIIFSDILVIPDALGQQVGFVEGEGPRLEPLAGDADIARLSMARLTQHLDPVYTAIRETRTSLPASTALIGFCGAPFTLAVYMIEGRGGSEFLAIKRWAYGNPQSFARLIDLLVQACVEHLDRQIRAGAETVQIFDTWAGVLPEEELLKWSVAPILAIADRLRQRHPTVPIIAFPRAVGPAIRHYAGGESLAAVSLDTGMSARWAATEIQPRIAVQGNLDPVMLLVGGEAQRQATRHVLETLAGGPFIFNLGHGVLQHTPPEHVERLVEQIRAWRAPT